MLSRNRSIVTASLLLLAVPACDNSTGVCVGDGAPGIALTVRAPDGSDISRTSWVVAVRVEPSPPAPVDSAQGYHDPGQGSPLAFTDDNAGRYVLRIRHDGFAPQEVSVTVPRESGDCGRVVTQSVTVNLAALGTE